MSLPLQHGLIIGATSSMAAALAHELAKGGASLVLCGRDTDELEMLSQDLRIRYSVHTATLAMDVTVHPLPAEALVDEAVRVFPSLNFAVIAVGDMAGEADDPAAIEHLALINYVAPAIFASALAARFHAMGGGVIAIIGSVAGDRGRQSNYVYGAAKAAIAAFASGLRNRYAGTRVHVMTVKPGFVDTPMTYSMNSPLIASREYVARAIAKAMQKRCDVLYVPWFWRFIMAGIAHLPEGVFKRMRL